VEKIVGKTVKDCKKFVKKDSEKSYMKEREKDCKKELK
jgi:hypothetical protein